MRACRAKAPLSQGSRAGEWWARLCRVGRVECGRVAYEGGEPSAYTRSAADCMDCGQGDSDGTLSTCPNPCPRTAHARPTHVATALHVPHGPTRPLPLPLKIPCPCPYSCYRPYSCPQPWVRPGRKLQRSCLCTAHAPRYTPWYAPYVSLSLPMLPPLPLPACPQPRACPAAWRGAVCGGGRPAGQLAGAGGGARGQGLHGAGRSQRGRGPPGERTWGREGRFAAICSAICYSKQPAVSYL